MKHRHVINTHDLVSQCRPRGLYWADFGAGRGKFTHALQKILGKEATVFAIDRDPLAIDELKQLFRDSENAKVIWGDFRDPLLLPDLDGFLVANALHFVEDPLTALHMMSRYLRPGGQIVIAEYDWTIATAEVPFPIPYFELTKLLYSCSFFGVREAARTPSNLGGEIYVITAFKECKYNCSTNHSTLGHTADILCQSICTK